jgi:solute carrier family 25 carnitine/acylcarnitine transporter 20/29
MRIYDLFTWTLPSVIGAFCNTYVGQPFDTIRVRMQDIDTKYKTSVDCLKHTIKSEGYRGLFKGSVASLYAAIAENTVVFGVNELLKQKLFNSGTKYSLSLSHDMMIGSISGLAATIASCPLETIKCNMQIDTSQKSLSDKYIFNGQMIQMIKKLSFSELYTGFGASCSRNIPFYILYFPLYSRYIELFEYISGSSQNIKNKKIDVINCAISGGLSGATTWAIVYPFDVIKCNQQIHTNTNINMMNMAKLIYKTNGFNGLYSGFSPTMYRAFFANFALMYGVELTNDMLGNDINKQPEIHL